MKRSSLNTNGVEAIKEEHYSTSFGAESEKIQPSSSFLDLCSVATETLKNDKSLEKIKTRPLSPPTEKKSSISFRRRLADYESFSLAQVKKMAPNTLLRLFSEPDFNEMKKSFVYRCRLLPPDKCSAVIKSFGNEIRAKSQMKSHLNFHLKELSFVDPEDLIFVPITAQQKSNQKIKMEHYQNIENIEHNNKRPSLLPAQRQLMIKKEAVVAVKSEAVEEDVRIIEEHCYAVTTTKTKKESKTYAEEEEDIDENDEIFEDDMSDLIEIVLESRKENERVIKEEASSTICEESNPQVPSVGSEVEVADKGNNKVASKSEREIATAAIHDLQSKGSSLPLEELVCRICRPPKQFTAYTTLLTHFKSHTGLKPFECSVCLAVFTRQHSLNYHMLIHSNQTRFTCSDCGRKFRHPSHYKEHRRRHTGELPFECSDCLLRYKTRNTFKRHLRVNHGKILTSSGVILLNKPTPTENIEYPDTTNDEEVAGFSNTNDRDRKPVEESLSESSDSSSSMSDNNCSNNEEISPVEEEVLPESLKKSLPRPTFKLKLDRSARKRKSPVRNFVTNPPPSSNVVTPKKTKPLSEPTDNQNRPNFNCNNKVMVGGAFKPVKPAFKPLMTAYDNVEIRKLVYIEPNKPNKPVLLNSENSPAPLLAEINGKRVLLIPKKNSPPPPPPSMTVIPPPPPPPIVTKSKLEHCLLYGSENAKKLSVDL